MTTAYTPPPEKEPELVPANRKPPAKTNLGAWLTLVVLGIAVYNLAQDPSTDVTTPAEPGWPFAIPLATFVALAAAFLGIRSRLPKSFRGLDLREQSRPAPSPAESPAPQPFEPIELAGRSGGRKANVRVDVQGVKWRVEASIGQPTQELELGWGELQQVTTTKLASPFVVWAIVTAGFGLAYARQTGAIGIVIPFVIAGVFGAIGWWRKGGGTLTVVSESHVLTLESRALEAERRAQIAELVRARLASSAPVATTSGWKAVGALFGLPFREARHLVATDATLLAEIIVASTDTLTPEQRLVLPIQRRLMALWYAGLGFFLPFSIVATVALRGGEIGWIVAVGFIFFIAGLITSLTSLRLVARLTGLVVLK